MSRPKPPPALPPLRPDHDLTGNHYWRYHDLEALLACKRPVTASADEDLFISVHQIRELGFHQMILDLDRTLDAFARALDAAPDGVVATPAMPATSCGGRWGCTRSSTARCPC
jgi:tryptophan 2,3-dioxygenase